MFAAEGFKFVAVFVGYFKNGFQAIGYKCRAKYQQSFFAFFGQLSNNLAGVGLYPWVAAQARLEAYRDIFLSAGSFYWQLTLPYRAIVPNSTIYWYRSRYCSSHQPAGNSCEYGRIFLAGVVAGHES
jgi:hypothetical protein